MAKSIQERVKHLERTVRSICCSVTNTSATPESPVQLTSDAIIYNADGPFDIKEGF